MNQEVTNQEVTNQEVMDLQPSTTSTCIKPLQYHQGYVLLDVLPIILTVSIQS